MLLSTGGKLLAAGGSLLSMAGSGAAAGGHSGIGEVALIGGGQSNAGYAETQDGALASLASGIAFYLGAASSAAYGSWNNSGTACTEVSGIGILELQTPGNQDLAFLANDAPNMAATAATAASAGLGTCGLGYQSFVSGLRVSAKAAIQAIVLYWGETDSLEFNQANKSVYKAACINWMSKVRGFLGKSAAALPTWWFGPPYSAGAADATIREVWAELAADPSQNALWIVPQTYDSVWRDAAISATGVASGGSNFGHRAAIDNIALFNRASIAGARSILSAAGLASTLIPAALGAGFGPAVVSASLSGSTVTVTVAHDAGTDLVVPLLASQGVGWAVMDGGSVASPGAIILATACARVDATHLAVTLASAPSNPASACRLFYPWNGANTAVQSQTPIGRGDAVTDNFAGVAKPAGFDITASLGATYGANYPLRPPVTVTGTGASAVAEYGIVLS